MVYLSVQFRKHFEISASATAVRTPDGACHGSVKISFSMRNTTAIPAVMPFIAFSALGLKVVNEADWVSEHFISHAGKKMQKFISYKHRMLDAGASATPCSMHLNVTQSFGGAITVARGFERSLQDTSDFRIPCHLGAGNFSPEASTVTISGKLLSELGRTLFEPAGKSAEVHTMPRTFGMSQREQWPAPRLAVSW